MDENPGLYRIDVTEGPGSGFRILNQPSPPAFKEAVSYAIQNLYARAQKLVGDRDPRSHEFSIQLRAFDASKTGSTTGVPTLLALCSSLLERSIKGGMIVVGGVNLGGSIDPIYNTVSVAELAVEKGAALLLMPVSARKQLFDLSDEMATKVDVQFYSDAREALFKALAE
jgi:ATP-dependent Lon protease